MKKNHLSVFAFAFATMLVSSAALAQDGYGYMAPGGGSGVGVNYETRLSNIEDQIRALTGKTEQLEYAVRRMDQALQRMQADYDARISKLETAPPAPTIIQQSPTADNGRAAAPPDEEAEVEETPSGRLGDLKMRGGRVTGAEKNPRASALPVKPDDYGLTAQEQYDRAFGLLRQANYDDAEKAFKGFIDKNPKDKLLDNAKYWYGETFYVRAKFNEAAVAFADAFQQNPKGSKAADSLLKLGMALGALGKTTDACTTFASLKKEFPTAVSLRARAEQERSRLKCK
ncbi:MAG: tol-pal system protein YbgF [Alphaproteobacteria bacterium]|nr:tol-pal system protein YbgF [Alphaproteobacteria bacterium]